MRPGLRAWPSFLAPVFCAGLLAACAVVPLKPAPLMECRALYAQADQKARETGAADPGLYRIPGFPYLRASRFLASFRDEVSDPARFHAWVTLLRAADATARDREIRAANGRMDWDPQLTALRDRLDRCGDELAQADLADPQARARLRDAVEVPSEYSWAQRLFGAYPLAVPFLNRGIAKYHDAVLAEFKKPLEPPAAGRMELWLPEADAAEPPATPEQVAAWIARSASQPLGIPAFSDAELRRMFAAYAPAWWVETAGDDDRPGSPAFDKAGKPTLDIGKPRTYVLQDYTRVNGEVLPQLVYIVWFSARPREARFDAYSGALDGLVWRVTLSADGHPLVYDTIHPCGCYHEYFPARALKRRDAGSFWNESALLPQDDPVGEGRVAVRIASGTHFVQRVLPLSQLEAGAGKSASRPYEFAPYLRLTMLPDAAGRPRDLFDPDTGIVAGTERLERWWLWVSGVKDPGAMRAWGRHAIQFVGEGHFDDPHILDQVFDFSGDTP